MAKQLAAIKAGQIFYPAPGFVEAFEEIKNGECVIEVKRQRNSKFHRKYMALLTCLFKHWQVEDVVYKNFDVFRKNIAILAGFYDQAYDMHGSVVLEAKSISFAAMDEIEFDALFNRTIDIGIKHVLHNYGKDDLDRVLEEILHFD